MKETFKALVLSSTWIVSACETLADVWSFLRFIDEMSSPSEPQRLIYGETNIPRCLLSPWPQKRSLTQTCKSQTLCIFICGFRIDSKHHTKWSRQTKRNKLC